MALLGALQILGKSLKKQMKSNEAFGQLWLDRLNALTGADAAEERELLEYLMSLPVADRWLESNPSAKASVDRGLRQAAKQQEDL